MSGSPRHPAHSCATSGRRPFGIRLVILALAVLLASTPGLSSPGASAAPLAALETIAAQLESGLAVAREEPFIQRAFQPMLEDRWIGQAVAYGCYRRGQAPGGLSPSRAELLEDLQIISRHWNLIRVYNADDDIQRVLELIRKHGLPLRVLLGVWLENEDDKPNAVRANRANLLRGIELTRAFPDVVLAVAVGNETQVDWAAHRMGTDGLVRYIRTLRAQVTVPVTTADDYLYWNKPASVAVAQEIDFITTHAHPLWNGQSLEGGLAWLDRTLDSLREVHPGRELVLGETGWATCHNSEQNGPGEQGTLIKGEANERAQGQFLIQLAQWVERRRVPTFLFEAFDEPWKGGGEQADPRHVEKHWGVFHEDRTPKASFRAFLEATGYDEPRNGPHGGNRQPSIQE